MLDAKDECSVLNELLAFGSDDPKAEDLVDVDWSLVDALPPEPPQPISKIEKLKINSAVLKKRPGMLQVIK